MYDGTAESFEALRNSSFKGAFLAAKDVIVYYNRKHWKRGTISISKDRIFLLPISIYFKKNTCLSTAFNEQIHKYTNGGLINTWADIFISEYSRRVKRRNLDLSAPEKLSLDQISGIIIICVVMYAFSGFVLGMEILSTKYKWIRVIFDVI